MNPNLTKLEFRIAASYILIMLLVPVGILSFLVYHGISNFKEGADWGNYLIFSVVVLVGITIYLWEVLSYRVYVNDGKLGIKSLFTNKNIALDALGHHSLEKDHIAIHRKGNGMPIFKIHLKLKDRELFQVWLRQHSNNPKEEKAETEYNEDWDEILQNKDFGTTELEREQNLAQAKWEVSMFTGGIIVSTLGLWIGRLFGDIVVDVSTMIIIVSPLLIVCLLYYYKGMIRVGLDMERNSPYPELYTVIVFCWQTVLYYVFFDGYLVKVEPTLLYVAAVIALILTSLTLWLSQDFKAAKNRFIAILCFYAVFFVYGWGTAFFVNVYHDHSNARTFEVGVVEKDTRSTDEGREYYLTLEPWHTIEGSNDVKVARSLYKKVEEGARVKIVLKEGNLGAEWYRIGLL